MLPHSRQTGGWGDGLFVRALWLNYDALLRIPRHAAALDGWHSFWKWLPAFPPRDFEQCSGTWSEELFHSFPTMQGDFAPRRKISSFFKKENERSVMREVTRFDAKSGPLNPAGCGG